MTENIQTETPEGVFMDAYAEFYSLQMAQNIQLGMRYNIKHALYSGHKVFGYGVDRATKKYIVDPDTAPFAQWMFT